MPGIDRRRHRPAERRASGAVCPWRGAAKRVARVLISDPLHRFGDEFGATTCRELTGADLSIEEGHEVFLDLGAWPVGCMRQIEFVVERLATLADQDEWAAALARVDPAAMAGL